MHENAKEVESNVLAADRFKGGIDREKRKKKSEISSSGT